VCAHKFASGTSNHPIYFLRLTTLFSPLMLYKTFYTNQRMDDKRGNLTRFYIPLKMNAAFGYA